MKEAGLLSDAQWKRYAESQEGTEARKSLLDILKQSAFSPETYRDLALYQVSLPFGQTREKKKQEIPGLDQPVTINAHELIQMLEVMDPGIASLTDLLREVDFHPSPPQITAISEAGGMGKKGYGLLVHRGIFTPSRFNQIVQSGKHPYAMPNRVQLASDILAHNNLCSLEDFFEAFEGAQKTGKPVGAILEKNGKLSGDQLAARLRDGLELPDVDIRAARIPRKTTDQFPGSFVRRHIFVPLKRTKTALSVAISDPLFISLCDTLSILTGLVIIPLFAPHGELLDRINALYPSEEARETAGERPAAAPAWPQREGATPEMPEPVSFPERGERAAAATEAAFEASVSNVSTVETVSSIIENAIASRATDIHIEPQINNVRIRYRVDGSLRQVTALPLDALQPVVARIKVLANMNVTERRRPQDGHFSLTIDSGAFDFRISSIPARLGEKIVVRILDQRTVLKAMSELGMTDFQERTLQAWILRPYGIILVTGPTGSGKSTTLYSCLNILNDIERNILTIEDPVEYQLPGINQVQIDPNIDLTFASGLRAGLRQDPDVIMVGEIRDLDTAKIAMRAAMTGHLVLSTLHTNNAVGAIAALKHMGIQPYVTASALVGVVAQRLLKTLCPHCRRRKKASDAMLRDFSVPQNEENKNRYFYQAAGCEHCMNSGYSGRLGVFEFLAIDERLREMIAEEAPEHQIVAAAKEAGLTTLLESAIEKLFNGETTTDEVLKTVLLTQG